MSFIAVVPLIFLAAIIAAIIFAISLARRHFRNAAPYEERTERALASSRARALIALGAAVLTLVFCISFPQMQDDLGVLVAMSPSLSAAVGLTTYALLPASGGPTGHNRRASLEPRRVWTFIGRGSAILVAGSLATLLVILVAAGLTANPDDMGRWSRSFTITSGPASSSSGPYPGWYYGIPIIISVILASGAALLALRRVALTPALVDVELARQDARRSEVSAQVIVLIVQAAALLQIAGVAMLMAGSFHIGATNDFPGFSWLAPLTTLVTVLGMTALIGSGVTIFFALYRALALPQEVRAFR